MFFVHMCTLAFINLLRKQVVPDDAEKQLQDLGINVKVLKQHGLSDEDLAALLKYIVKMVRDRY